MDSASDACGDIIEYKPANLVDGRRDTSWQVAGTGVGERVELRYEKPIKVSGVGIIPGYDKTDPCDSTYRFYQIYVIRKVRIEFSDGSSVGRTFEQKPEMQLCDMPDNETTSVRLLILETYPPGNMRGQQPYPFTIGKVAPSEVKVEDLRGLQPAVQISYYVGKLVSIRYGLSDYSSSTVVLQ